ncbi:MAG: bifunctional UDP-N-acetylglucosamine diphosphorylase/glucosamine-1-phosphate N-acetyltransferase GlmU [Succinivibrionaceae bacterium]
MSLEVIVLAAGKGTRMRSSLPKVLHKVGGKELINHVINSVSKLNPKKIHIVYGHEGELVRTKVIGDYNWVKQEDLLGTGHAVLQALPYCDNNSDILVLVSDIPLITSETLSSLIYSLQNSKLAVLTCKVQDPFGLGRIKRDEKGIIQSIIEEKDCSEDDRLIQEINTGVFIAKKQILESLLRQVKNDNKSKEYYLTDIVSIARSNNLIVDSYTSHNTIECEGINNKIQLAKAERYYQKVTAEKYMNEGLWLLDPCRVDFRGSFTFGTDCVIDTNVIIEGNVELGNNVYIGTGCYLKDCKISDGTIISPYTVIDNSVIKSNATIGPFARLRPGCVLEDEVHIGNFVEVKNSKIGKGSKSGHLSYLGDAVIGKNVNIGAGTITCNYDGANKWKTEIGDDVFVGSDTQIVAPVTIDNGATIGAGTTVTKHVPSDSLVITRTPMKFIEKWQRPKK